MVTLILLLSFLILLLLKFPISIAMGIASLLALFVGDYSLLIAPQVMGSGVMSYTLMAVPFFVFAGNLMNDAGITKRIFDFASAMVGHLKGGIAQVNVLASMIFAGISGSFVADTAGLGTVEMKAMKDRGYDDYFAAAVTVSSSTIGPIIPPSIILIIYAIGAQVSIAKLFVAGLLPGILIGVFFMVQIYIMAVKNPELSKETKVLTFKELLIVARDSILAVISPLIVLGGMISGMVTPTEVGILAVMWSIIVGIVYKDFSIKRLPKVLFDSFLSSAHIMFLIAVGNLMGWIIAADGAGETIAAALISVSDNRIILLLLVNLAALIIGTLMEPTPALLVTLPIFAPVMSMIGVDPVHFGIILCLNLTIGMLTPPVGLGLYVMCSVSKLEFEPLVKSVMPFLLVLILSLLVITFWPDLSLFLPRLLLS